MWKCGFRRLKDTAERGVNRFEKCNSSYYNPCSAFFNQCERKNFPTCWLFVRKCWKRFDRENDTKDKRWNFEHLNRTWIGAIAWSSALVFGWYTSQIIHLKFKTECKSNKFCVVPKVHNLFVTLPYGKNSQKDIPQLDITQDIGKLNHQSIPVVHLVSHDPTDGSSDENNKSWNSGSSRSTENELGEVLNSIENRLGLASIENGQHKEGINLLRSAANRNHAPALYNLGLCYELGLGVAADEKMAMELYRTAALLHHPKALYNLGIYYGQGRGGLSRDTVTATRLLRLAAIQGQEEAISALKGLDIELDSSSEDCEVSSPSPLKKENHAPTHSALFIENLQLSNFNYEPIVF